MNLGAALLSSMLFFACNGDGGGNSPTPPDPAPIKEKIATLQTELDAKQKQLDQKRMSIEIQGRALMPDELDWLDRFGGWLYDYSEWKKAWENGGKDANNNADLEGSLKKLEELKEKADGLQV